MPPAAKTPPTLPLSETLKPADQAELATIVRGCFAEGTAVYPLGGETSLDFGLPAKAPGIGLSLAGLTQVVDYPARDMTITVEAGVTMQALAEMLAKEGQRLPIDVPKAAQATLGGVVATNWNGPRRFGEGQIRDYVIGISAVDGTGMPYKGGGRVVKNVAGYDFCKLLTGSLGTLGVITQITLRLKPIPPVSQLALVPLTDLAMAERVLASLTTTLITPTAVELLGGPEWADVGVPPSGGTVESRCWLALGLEGTQTEVAWQVEQLRRELTALEVPPWAVFSGDDATKLWRSLAEFAQSKETPLVLKAALTPSLVTTFLAAARELDPQVSFQSHAGNGIAILRFPALPATGLSRALVGRLAPLAQKASGSVTILSNPSGAEMTRQAAFGGVDVPYDVMTAVKRQFDPKNILNPGRFVYAEYQT